MSIGISPWTPDLPTFGIIAISMTTLELISLQSYKNLTI